MTDELLPQVRQAWLDVLGLEEVPLDVNFFETGGNSLLLIILHGELSSLASRELLIADLYRSNTVLSQVQLLAQEGAKNP
ncbi:phosphopantetheine-binding protein [Streptomyces sp. NPDC006544]|uniref:phosphopantetheine-binding protein n=1 Tax=Streptomyces sp. NPDC006544 TaxID=3154583 RepID=UPI0033A9FF85